MKVVLFLLSLFVFVYPQFLHDRLSPYEDGFHGSIGRSARDVANCQHEQWGNSTNDKYDMEIPMSSYAKLLYQLHRSRYLMGSIAFVSDPYYTFSVLEPSTAGGCEMKYFTASRSTLSETVHRRLHGCTVATNAGYFSMRNGKCLGSVVSDGRIVHISKDLNANFGVRQDGSVVVGYIDPEEIQKGYFRQLISGVIWLVRNGTNYVNESMKIECPSHQDTGMMSTFVNVLSARTAVGLDGHGRVVVAHVDGQTHSRGANLYEFADLLINHGVKSAINLDGGGSSTFLHKDVLINYPSDHCIDPAYRCERRVSTILCFHDVQCLEPTCNGHGQCTRGLCVCHSPWMGEVCSQLNCSLQNCSSHGNCSNGACSCEAGWGGDTCNQACSSGSYGPGCTLTCHCFGHSVCDKKTGKCNCPPGYYDFGCWKKCAVGFYGDGCLQRCPPHNCSGHGECSSVDGSCLCFTNWTMATCNQSTEFNTMTYYDETIPSSEPNIEIVPSSEPNIESIRSSEQSIHLTQDSNMDIAPTSSKVTSQSPASVHVSNPSQATSYFTPVVLGCITGSDTSHHWLYSKYLTPVLLLVLILSILLHIVVCVGLRRRTASGKTAHINTLLTRKRRKKRKRITQIAQESSSSDCSI